MKNYKQKKKLAWQKIGDHTLLLDMNGKKMAHHLDEVGTFLWKILEEKSSQTILLDRVVNGYDVEKEKAICDIQIFLKSLLNLGLIEVIDE